MKARGGVRVLGIVFTSLNALSGVSVIVLLMQGMKTPQVVLQPLAGLAAGIGLLLLQNWARWLTVLIAGYSASYDAYALVKVRDMFPDPYRPLGFALLVAVLAWNMFILWYFLQSGVKAQFVQHRDQ
jgi:hypothetical protein